MKQEALFCLCSSPEHIVTYTFDEDIVYLTINLNSYSFLKRLWLGLKYILGFKTKYGHYDVFIINPNDAGKLKSIYKHLNALKNE